MCTLTWRARRNGAGYELWFNRDEVNTREAELPPRLWAGGEAGCDAGGYIGGATMSAAGGGARENRSGRSFLAPVDSTRGGTWLAVNDAGLTAALLNDYAVAWRPPAPSRSRGDLVVAVARANGIDAVARARLLTADALRNTAAFTLVVLEADGGCASWHWDGVTVAEARGAEVPSFFSSSSYRTAEVIAARRAGFARLVAADAADEAARRMYHFFHDTARGAESVLMCRPDANTRSVCRVSVDAGEAVLEYVPVARGAAGPEVGEARRWSLPMAGARRPSEAARSGPA